MTNLPGDVGLIERCPSRAAFFGRLIQKVQFSKLPSIVIVRLVRTIS